MSVKRNRKLIVPTLAILTLSLAVSAWAQGSHGGHRDHRDALGSRFEATHDEPRLQPRHGVDPVRHWNEIALIANALDHTPVAPGEDRDFGEQLGPCRTSRALAIVHIAIFDAVNAIAGGYESYTGLSSARDDTSMDAAIAQAAHDTLVALFPSQTASFDEQLDEALSRIQDHREKRNGIHLGRRAAAAILALRADDGSQHDEPLVGSEYMTSNQPGRWRQDPISQIPIALGALWGGVRPFVLQSADQFRAPLPPALDSPEYAAAFNEVKSLGGDGVTTETDRNAEQTTTGIYWGYDGTPALGTPPRLYNQIAVHIADQRRSDAGDLARLLALANVAMADTCIAVWESKYFYDYWRPVTGIREADQGTGPTGLGDGNPATDGDLTYTPLGAPASNLKVPTPNFTPPFPAYPSGHAGFGGALFRILRKFYRTDDIAFTFVSDEFNGLTRDNKGNVRPLLPRHFSSLSEAKEENGQSRIYLGIHWAFDKTEGIAQGQQVADYVYDNAFERLRR
jgi:hypothetical protein